MTLVRLEPAALRSRVKHSTAEPLRSLKRIICVKHFKLELVLEEDTLFKEILTHNTRWAPDQDITKHEYMLKAPYYQESESSNFIIMNVLKMLCKL